MQLFHWCFALALTGLPLPSSGQGQRVEAGPLILDVHVSRTANLFHAVDQISGWSPFCHDQYLAAFGELDAEDRAMLAEHVGVRAKHSWGQGLEQAFYVEHELEQALELAVTAGLLSAEESEVERRVFLHFAERSDRLLERELERLFAFAGRIESARQELGQLAESLERLMGRAPEPVPVFLMANPSETNLGGGFNGGKLTLEVPSGNGENAFGTFVHEAFHAFLELEREHMIEVTKGVHPLMNDQTLNEGLAHAIAPGLYHNMGPDRDALAERVTWFREQGKTLSDYDYRVHRYGLALRPLVEQALADETMSFEALCQRALDVWRELPDLKQTSPVPESR